MMTKALAIVQIGEVLDVLLPYVGVLCVPRIDRDADFDDNGGLRIVIDVPSVADRFGPEESVNNQALDVFELSREFQHLIDMKQARELAARYDLDEDSGAARLFLEAIAGRQRKRNQGD